MCRTKCDIMPKDKPKIKVKKTKDDSPRSYLLDFEIKGAVNFTTEQKAGLVYALQLQREVLNSQEFKIKFLTLNCRQKSLNGEDMSMKDIYDFILKGKSNLDKTEDHDLDYFVTLYDGSTSTLGSTSMSTGKIRTNRKVFNRWLANEDYQLIASHLFHEQLHSIGWVHKWDWGRRRQSFVYRAGYLVRDMVKAKIEGTIKFTPIPFNSIS